MSSIVRASFWLIIAELVFNLSGYIIHSVLGRSLGPADYGRYGLIITFSTAVVVLIGRGVPVAMSKYLSEVRKQDAGTILSVRRTSAIVQTILVGGVTLLYFLLAPVFAKLLNDPSLTELFRLSSLIIPAFALASFYVYYFNGLHFFNSQSLIKFYRGISKTIFIIALALFFKLPGAIIGHVFAPFSVFMLAFWLDPYKKSKPSKKPYVSWKKLLQFAWPITVFMIFYEVMISIDLFLVKALLRDDAVTGFYNAALTVGRIPFYAFYFLTIILLPKISESTSSKDASQTNEVMRSSMKFLFILLIPSVTLLSLFAESITRFFYGAAYTPAAQPLSLLSFGLGFLTVFYVLAFVLNGAGKNKLPMMLSIIGALMNGVLGFFLIKEFGVMGAAFTVGITSLILTIFIVWYSNIKVSRFFSWKSIALYSLFSALLYFAGNALLPQGRFIFILWSIILLAIYFALLYVIGEIKKSDLRFFWNSLRKKKV